MKVVITVIVALVAVVTLGSLIINTVLTETERHTYTFVEIKEVENRLFYDEKTNIVYVRVITPGSTSPSIIPYYAPNGLPYRYDPEKQELVMIGE